MIVPSLLSLIAPMAMGLEWTPTPAPEPKPAPAPAVEPGTSTGQPLVVTGAEEKGFAAENSGTATKLDIPLQDTPQAVVVVPKELLQSQGFTSLRDALRNVPGLSIAAGENSRTGDRLNIRGFSADNDLFTDGLRDNGQYFRDTFNLEQIEVIKGPSALLFGRGSTGGAVNQVTKTPRESFAADASLTAGSYDLLRGQVGIGGPLGESVGSRLDFFVQDAESFRDEQHSSRWAIAPTLAFAVTDDTTLTIQYLRQKEDSSHDYGVPIYNGKPIDVDISTYYGWKDDAFQEYDIDTYTTRLDTRLSEEVTLRCALRYSEYSRYYRTEAFSGAVILDTNSANFGQVNRTQSLFLNDQSNTIAQSDLQWNTKVFGRQLNAVLGAELSFEDYEVTNSAATLGAAGFVDAFNPNSPATTGALRVNNLTSGTPTNTRTQLNTYSTYGMAAYEFVPTVTGVVGLRIDRLAMRYRAGTINYTVSPAIYTPNATLPNAESDHVLYSPRLGLVWEPKEEVTVYASYSTSYNPTAENLTVSGATASPTETLDPEKTHTYELGAKATVLDDLLSVTAAIFRVHKTDARTPDPNGGTLNVLDGEQITDGIELGATGTVTSRFNLFAGVALLQSEVTESNAVATPTPTLSNPVPVANSVRVEGHEVANVANVSGSVWATYNLGWNLTLGGGVFYVGERWADSIETVQLDDYIRCDLSLAWQKRLAGVAWHAQLNVFNALDEVYYETATGTRAYAGAPVSGQLTLGASF